MNIIASLDPELLGPVIVILSGALIYMVSLLFGGDVV